MITEEIDTLKQFEKVTLEQFVDAMDRVEALGLADNGFDWFIALFEELAILIPREYLIKLLDLRPYCETGGL